MKDFLFNIGEIVDVKNGKLKILKQSRYKTGEKRYEIQCLKCNIKKYITEKSLIKKSPCNHCSKNKFKLSKDKSYWIGTTQNGIDFLFNGDEKTVKYIMSKTWRRNTYGYFQNNKGERLHRVVMDVYDTNIYINHLGGNKYDNRKEHLTISNTTDNSKEKKISSRNTSGIIGLVKRKNKWIGNLKIKNKSVSTKYKTRDEAIIDLLIAQRHYGFRHNINLYYLLNNINKERIEEVIKNIERQLNKNTEQKIKSHNRYILSECGNYYKVYNDNQNKYFKIDIQDRKLVERGIWHIAKNKNQNNIYVHGQVIINNQRKTVKLHRYLYDLLDIKYKDIHIDHLDGDGMNNRRCNLQLTNSSGNGKNKPAKGYHIRKNGTFRAAITINNKRFSKTFVTKKEAVDWYNMKKKESLNNRLKFNNKKEIDEYLDKIK